MPETVAPPTHPIKNTAPGWLRWLTRASVVGLSISLLAHAVGLLVFGSLVVGPGGSGATGADAPEIELAIATNEQLAELEQGSPGADAPGSTALKPARPLSDVLTELRTQDVTTSATVPSELIGTVANPDAAVIGGGSVGAEFFGIEARGNRFAYVVDLSGSMDGARLETLKRELLNSVEALPERAKFIVVTYNDSAAILGGRTSWSPASSGAKRWLRVHAIDLGAIGGTHPATAFKLLRRLGTAPDAVFFMTDGDFDEANRLEVLRIQRELGVPIHAVTLDSRTGESAMQEIARVSGGTYRHVSRSGGTR